MNSSYKFNGARAGNGNNVFMMAPRSAITAASGNSRFSNVTNPAAPQVNIAVVKDTSFGERYKMQFRAESFNISNTVIRGGPITQTFNSAGFGQLPKSQNNFPRLVQLALKLSF